MSNGSSLAVLGILLPTLIHVSLFTLVFMALGAYRSGASVQAALVVALSRGDRDDPAAAAVGRNPDPELRQGRTGLFRQCRPGARPAVRHSGSRARYPADEPARLRLHLSLPELVHQSRGDPLGRGAQRRGSRSIAAASAASTALYFYDYAFGFTLLLALSLSISCSSFRSTAWRCGSSAPRSRARCARDMRGPSRPPRRGRADGRQGRETGNPVDADHLSALLRRYASSSAIVEPMK